MGKISELNLLPQEERRINRVDHPVGTRMIVFQTNGLGTPRGPCDITISQWVNDHQIVFTDNVAKKDYIPGPVDHFAIAKVIAKPVLQENPCRSVVISHRVHPTKETHPESTIVLWKYKNKGSPLEGEIIWWNDNGTALKIKDCQTNCAESYDVKDAHVLAVHQKPSEATTTYDKPTSFSKKVVEKLVNELNMLVQPGADKGYISQFDEDAQSYHILRWEGSSSGFLV